MTVAQFYCNKRKIEYQPDTRTMAVVFDDETYARSENYDSDPRYKKDLGMMMVCWFANSPDFDNGIYMANGSMRLNQDPEIKFYVRTNPGFFNNNALHRFFRDFDHIAAFRDETIKANLQFTALLEEPIQNTQSLSPRM